MAIATAKCGFQTPGGPINSTSPCLPTNVSDTNLRISRSSSSRTRLAFDGKANAKASSGALRFGAGAPESQRLAVRSGKRDTCFGRCWRLPASHPVPKQLDLNRVLPDGGGLAPVQSCNHLHQTFIQPNCGISVPLGSAEIRPHIASRI